MTLGFLTSGEAVRKALGVRCPPLSRHLTSSQPLLTLGLGPGLRAQHSHGLATCSRILPGCNKSLQSCVNQDHVSHRKTRNQQL